MSRTYVYVISRGGGHGSTTPVAVTSDLGEAKEQIKSLYGGTLVEPFVDAGVWRGRVNNLLDWVWIHRVPLVDSTADAVSTEDGAP